MLRFYSHNFVARTWCLAIALVISVHAIGPCTGADIDPVARLIEATESSRAGLQSFEADAVFRHWDGDGLLNSHALIAMQRAEDRFRMDIRYQTVERPTGFGYDRVILISDGKSLFANSFSDRIRPAGCEIRVRAKNFSTFMIASGGLGLNPVSLSRMMLGDLSSIKNKIRPAGKTDAGHDLFKYDMSEHFEILIEANPEVGFNVVRYEGRGTKAPDNSTVYTAEWDHRDSVWFIRKLVRVMRVGGEEESRNELEFTSFKPNVPIPPERFTLDALEPCEKTRLIDDRPDAEVKISLYDPGVNEKELDAIAEQVKALPARVPPPRDPLRVEPGRQLTLLWLVAFNVAVLLALAAFFGYRWLRARRAGR